MALARRAGPDRPVQAAGASGTSVPPPTFREATQLFPLHLACKGPLDANHASRCISLCSGPGLLQLHPMLRHHVRAQWPQIQALAGRASVRLDGASKNCNRLFQSGWCCWRPGLRKRRNLATWAKGSCAKGRHRTCSRSSAQVGLGVGGSYMRCVARPKYDNECCARYATSKLLLLPRRWTQLCPSRAGFGSTYVT